MKKQFALNAVLAAQWYITPDALQLIADIAAREHEFAGNVEALEAKLGRPLQNTHTTTVRDGVALIPVDGPLFHRASWFQAVSGATDYTTIATDLTAAMEDPNIRGIMLQINSPGGEVSGLSDLVAMIAGASKPVWAHIDGQCCSAAYWLASATQRVSASATAIVGSIGAQIGMTVRDPKPGERTYRFVSSQSPFKNAGPDTEEGAKRYQALVDDLGKVFVDAVAANRKVSSDFVIENFGQGGVMVAEKAKAGDIIDNVSTFEAAFAKLQQELYSMQWKDLTAQALAENRADIVAAIRTEALATVEKVDIDAVRADAAKAERERIVAIEALAMPGAEKIVADCKADGTSPEAAAVKIVQHMRTAQATQGASALAAIKDAETKMVPPNASADNGSQSDEEKAIAAMEGLRKAGMIR